MKKSFRAFFLPVAFFAIFYLILPVASYATHVFGVDLYYTWVSGNTYTVNMTIYGDCSASLITSLSTSTPTIQVYNGTTLFTTFTLSPGSPQGVEVTPVCAAQASNTACNGGTIPGVRKYIYSANVTLNTTSANWKFHFNGNLGNSSAGRSSQLSNIQNAGNTIIALDATLNNSSTNTTGNNSSPTYTTIATPFFCINQPASFNPGAVDPNNDSLSFALVAGWDQSLNVPVTYTPNPPINATNPLTISGSLIFSNSTGQLNFTPNAGQRSLVVYTVTEYRNGVLVGTSQREMTFVVLTNCSNTPPRGIISNPVGGGVSIVDSTHLDACSSQGAFSFQINPTDSSNANITVTSAGLPAGATFTVTNNATPTPHGTFNWNTTGVTPGSYTFFLTLLDDNCPLSSKQTIAYTVTVLPDPTNVFTLVSPASCIKKAVFTITPGGGSPYVIKVMQGANTLQTFTSVTTTQTDSLVPGTYTFRVTNVNGCYKDTTVTIAVPPVIVPSVSMTSPSCPGTATGSITLTAGGGLSPFSYAIGGGGYSAINTFNGLAAGAYTLHIKDANTCIHDTTVNLPDAPPILAAISVKQPTCNHYQNGAITVNAYNTYTPYTYALNSGPFSSTNTFSNLGAASDTIRIRDGHNCLMDSVFILTDSLAISATFNLTNILCNSNTTGVIVVNASGGFGQYSYAINTSTPVSNNTFSNLAAGTYAIHIKDDSLCYLDTSVSLTQPAPLAISPALTNVQCYGTPTGQIVATTTGGVSPYTFSLNNGPYGASNTFGSLVPGTYIIHVDDANNCPKADTVSITSPSQLQITAVVQANVTCNGQSNGSLTVTASGGTTPYSYAVNAAAYAPGNVISGLAAGTYTVHVKDANGCIHDSASFTITQPTVIVPALQVTNSTCHTLANGHVTVSATGGTTGYTYSEGSGPYGTSGYFSPLSAGSYTFHVKDANGCIHDTTITIVDSLNVIGTATVSPASCYGLNNGRIVIPGSGGSSPYTYAMSTSPYASTDTFSSLLAGTYIIHIKDANGCIKDTSIVVAQPTLLVPSITVTSPSCYGFKDGSVTVSASGGTPGYVYAIGSGLYSALTGFPGLGAGTDTVYVKDNNGCIHDTSFAISQPSPLLFDSLVLSDNKCNGDSSGWVQVYVSGAVSPYSYAVNGGASQPSSLLSNLRAGNEAIVVKDNHNCPLDTTVVLTQPSHLAFVVDAFQNPTCAGYKDGAITLHATGGTPQYRYSMNNSNSFGSQTTYSQIGEGTDLFYIKDANGCIYDTSVEFIGYPHITIDGVTLQSPACYGFSNGILTVAASGGDGALLFQLGNGIFTDKYIFDSLASNTYTITVKDGKGCLKDTTVKLTQPDSLHLEASLSPNECSGIDNQGAINISVSGGTAPYSYLWSANPGANSPSLTGMPNGNYMVWVTDQNRCSDSLLTSVVYDDCCKPFVPNAFTPNGDGKDDLFRIRFKGDMTLIEFSVYNRFGQQVYHSSYVDQGWDGTLNGVPQEIGAYNYYIKAYCGNKKDHEISLKGTVTLIR